MEKAKTFGTVQEFMDNNRVWTDQTFGKLNAVAALKHLRKEVNETIEAIELQQPEEHIREEFADMFLLLLNACSKHGLTFHALYNNAERKMIINRARKWGQVNNEGFIEHVKEEKA